MGAAVCVCSSGKILSNLCHHLCLAIHLCSKCLHAQLRYFVVFVMWFVMIKVNYGNFISMRIMILHTTHPVSFSFMTGIIKRIFSVECHFFQRYQRVRSEIPVRLVVMHR